MKVGWMRCSSASVSKIGDGLADGILRIVRHMRVMMRVEAAH